MIDAKRIILPKNVIKHIMERLHAGHAGQDKTVKLAHVCMYVEGPLTTVSMERECAVSAMGLSLIHI